MKLKEAFEKIEYLKNIGTEIKILEHNEFDGDPLNEEVKIRIFLTKSNNTNIINLNPELSSKIVSECLNLLKQEFKGALKELKDNNINLEEDDILMQ